MHQRMKGNKMKHLGCIIKYCLIITFSIMTVSCCDPPTQPKHPGKVKGWLTTAERDESDIIAVLVLKKGEKSQQGSIGVEIVDIFPPEKPCAFDSIGSLPRTSIRFYSPQNGSTVCEQIVYGPSNTNVACASAIGVYTVGIQAINTQDNWILIDLRGKIEKE